VECHDGDLGIEMGFSYFAGIEVVFDVPYLEILVRELA
jgi:hypothetical protein